jgi:hypothetical protein
MEALESIVLVALGFAPTMAIWKFHLEWEERE